MNSELAPKIIVASGMAVVVGVIAVTFSLRSNHPSPVTPISPPPAAVAQIPDAPAAVAPIPDAAAPIVSQDSVGAGIGATASAAAPEPQVAGNPDPGKALISGDITARALALETSANSREKSAAKNRAKSVDGAKAVHELTMPAATTPTAVDDGEIATSHEPAESPPS